MIENYDQEFWTKKNWKNCTMKCAILYVFLSVKYNAAQIKFLSCIENYKIAKIFKSGGLFAQGNKV